MSDTTKAPHCPRCGGARDAEWAFCGGCHFNAEWRGVEHGWRAVTPWEPAVRAELARQAMEMRAHSMAVDAGAIAVPGQMLASHRAAVMYDYMMLGASPLRLPGEEQ